MICIRTLYFNEEKIFIKNKKRECLFAGIPNFESVDQSKVAFMKNL